MDEITVSFTPAKQLNDLPGGEDAAPQHEPTTSNNARRAVHKKQPWKSVWPRTGPLEGQVMRYYGFKKGERMSVPGNAGDFFAHGNWNVEYET